MLDDEIMKEAYEKNAGESVLSKLYRNIVMIRTLIFLKTGY